MDAKKIEELKDFVELYKQSPSVLHTPPLAFFRNFLQSLGARIPAFGESSKDGEEYEDNVPMAMDDSSKADNFDFDVELDYNDVVEPDNDPLQKMGDPSAEVTEENEEAAQLSNAKAMEAFANGEYTKAIGYLTDAILLNPKSAILYANRAVIYIELEKPEAAIRDADAALQIKPDLARGLKARGIARGMLGFWAEAGRDLHEASNLDFDEEIAQMIKKIEPNTKKIEQKELRETEPERKRRRDAEATSSFKDGEIIAIHSGSELKEKLNAASETSLISLLRRSMMRPLQLHRYLSIFMSVAARYPKAVFLEVDIDEITDAAAEWSISSIVCYFSVKNGEKVDKFVGVDNNALYQKFAPHAEIFMH